MATWFTADTHFGHANIINLCARPFATADEMDEGLIARWNACVSPADVVWHLGDMFSFKPREIDLTKAAGIVRRLNGEIHLLRGNHDVQPWLDDVARMAGSPFFIAGDYATLLESGQRFVLFHYPLESWDGMYHGTIHLHGHCHGKLKRVAAGRLDVGVDARQSLAPIALDVVIRGLDLLLP